LNDPEKNPKSAFEAMKEAMKDDEKDDAVSSSANARPGDFVAGKGYKTFDGGFVRGQARNAGGGRLDTVVRNDGKKGDYIAQGPRAVETATTTLRPKMPIAGGEDVRPDPGQSVVSDTTFETFSQLPEETTDHMQAPNSRLNQLNRQNETLRYMEHMAQPRQYNPANDPHGRPWQWSDEFSKPMFQQAFASEVKRHLDEQGASSRYMHREDMDDRLEEDYTSYGSSKRLRRPRPTPYSTVDMNIESMLPSRQEVGVLMNRRRFRDQDRSTWRSVL